MKITCVLSLAVALAGAASAQQVPVPDNQPPIPRPAYETGKGPVVAIDGAHKNTHSYGRLQGFVRLLTRDGYRVRPLAEPISAASLEGVEVLVTFGPGGWVGPEASFSGTEETVLLEWVREGGSLLLVLDHSPAPEFAQRLTAAVGIEAWQDGFVGVETAEGFVDMIMFHRAPQETRPVLTRTTNANLLTYQGTDARVEEHAITRGRGTDEQVSFVLPFVGSAFRPPAGAESLLVLPQKAVSVQRAWLATESRWVPVTPDSPRTPVGGWSQGAVLKFGKGRVALFAESGLFSGQWPVHPAAAENYKLALNVMRWLTGVL